MNLLIDTHVLIWLLAASPHLPDHIRNTLADRRHTLYLSIASTWEMAIKVGLGKLDLPPNLLAWLPGELDAAGIRLLPIELEHALGVETLPHHHRDPFDRVMIAQALADGMTIVTADHEFAQYDVPILNAS